MNLEVKDVLVRKSIVVDAPQAHVFDFFAEKHDLWWPRAHHIGSREKFTAVLEPRVGGRWFERGDDGSECPCGRVLAWEPPDRVVFTWQISGAWQFDPNPDHASEIEVLFVEDGPEQTRVEVEHRYFERLDGGQAIHDAIRSGGSWAVLLESYAKTAANAR